MKSSDKFQPADKSPTFNQVQKQYRLQRALDDLAKAKERRYNHFPEEFHQDKLCELLDTLPEPEKHTGIIKLCQFIIDKNFPPKKLTGAIYQHAAGLIAREKQPSETYRCEPFRQFKNFRSLSQPEKINLYANWLTLIPLMRVIDYARLNPDFFVRPKTINRYFAENKSNRERLTTTNQLGKIAIPLDNLYNYFRELKTNQEITRTWKKISDFPQAACTVKEWIKNGVIDNSQIRLIKYQYYINPDYFRSITDLFTIEKTSQLLRLDPSIVRGLIVSQIIKTSEFNNQQFVSKSELNRIMVDQIYNQKKYLNHERYYTVSEISQLLSAPENIIRSHCQKNLINHVRLKITNTPEIFISQQEYYRLKNTNCFETSIKRQQNHQHVSANPDQYVSFQSVLIECGLSERVLEDIIYSGKIKPLNTGFRGKNKPGVFIHKDDLARLKQEIADGAYQRCRSIRRKKELANRHPDQITRFHQHHHNYPDTAHLLGIDIINLHQLNKFPERYQLQPVLFGNQLHYDNQTILRLLINKKQIFPTLSQRLTPLENISGLNPADLHYQLIDKIFKANVRQKTINHDNLIYQIINRQLGQSPSFSVSDLESMLLIKYRTLKDQQLRPQPTQSSITNNQRHYSRTEVREFLNKWCRELPLAKLVNYIRHHPEIPCGTDRIYHLLANHKIPNLDNSSRKNLFNVTDVQTILAEMARQQQITRLWIPRANLKSFLPNLLTNFTLWLQNHRLIRNQHYQIINKQTYFDPAKILEIYRQQYAGLKFN